ncbi:MAG: hypothetical protein ACQET5_08915 [Halobacteriota archaeon]|uniref:hypothetical protein n=1 Tax=Natronomonas sp. TaxID=2184060 RepID=UPI00397518DD
MATQDARSTTLRDFDVDPAVVARGHTPSLYSRERFVRCESCGVTVPYSVTAEGPVRRALDELASIPCGRYELPDVSVGDHIPTVTPEHPTKGRSVVCESCGRSARLGENRRRVLKELATIPCAPGLTGVELVDLVFSPTAFTPLLSDLGIDRWYGRFGGSHDEEIVRQFRHERFQYTAYVRVKSDGTHAVALSISPNGAVEPLDKHRFPSADSTDPAARRAAVTFVTFLSATDPLTAGEFETLHSAYEDAYRNHRERWIGDAYDDARDAFENRFGDTPEAFTDAFADSSAGIDEVLRRMIGSGGFSDQSEVAFAAETLGHEHEFPGFIDFVAERHGWSPPISDE